MRTPVPRVSRSPSVCRVLRRTGRIGRPIPEPGFPWEKAVSGKRLIDAGVRAGRDDRCEPSSISSTLLERLRARRPEAWQRLVDLYGPNELQQSLST